ncbi:MAG TPA: hypothetical protein VH855_26020 [Acetobacteraceae bacterium]
MRIHAPYTHVPYDERIDEGYPNFVNNDHCLLSARATLHLARLVPQELAMPMAQTIWYIPTGLDIWNQKINRAPGHYTRGFTRKIDNTPTPVVYWPDQQPMCSDAPLGRAAWRLAHHGAARRGARRLPLLPRAFNCRSRLHHSIAEGGQGSAAHHRARSATVSQ